MAKICAICNETLSGFHKQRITDGYLCHRCVQKCALPIPPNHLTTILVAQRIQYIESQRYRFYAFKPDYIVKDRFEINKEDQTFRFRSRSVKELEKYPEEVYSFNDFIDYKVSEITRHDGHKNRVIRLACQVHLRNPWFDQVTITLLDESHDRFDQAHQVARGTSDNLVELFEYIKRHQQRRPQPRDFRNRSTLGPIPSTEERILRYKDMLAKGEITARDYERIEERLLKRG